MYPDQTIQAIEESTRPVGSYYPFFMKQTGSSFGTIP